MTPNSSRTGTFHDGSASQSTRSHHTPNGSAQKMPPIPERSPRQTFPTSNPLSLKPRQKRPFLADEPFDSEYEQRRLRHANELRTAAGQHDRVLSAAQAARVFLQAREDSRQMEEYQLELARCSKEQEERLKKLEEQNRMVEKAREDAAKVAELERRLAAAKAREASEAAEAEKLAKEQAAKEQAAKEQAAKEKAAAEEAARNILPPATAPASGSVADPKLGTPQSQSQPAQTLKSSHIIPTEEKKERASKYFQLFDRLEKFVVKLQKEFRAGGDTSTLSELRIRINRNCGQISSSEVLAKERATDIIQKIESVYSPRPNEQNVNPVRFSKVDIKDYALDIETGQAFESQQVPAVLVYAFAILANKLADQIMLDNISLMRYIAFFAMTIYTHPGFFVNGKSLISTLLAKYHDEAACLFGIYGRFKDAAGNEFVVQYHEDDRKLQSLGAGFAHMAFWKPPLGVTNPLPPRFVWSALAFIYNMPSNQLSASEVAILRGLLETDPTRFLELYGQAGKVMLRFVCRSFSKRVTAKGTGAAYFDAAFPALLKGSYGIDLS